MRYKHLVRKTSSGDSSESLVDLASYNWTEDRISPGKKSIHQSHSHKQKKGQMKSQAPMFNKKNKQKQSISRMLEIWYGNTTQGKLRYGEESRILDYYGTKRQEDRPRSRRHFPIRSQRTAECDRTRRHKRERLPAAMSSTEEGALPLPVGKSLERRLGFWSSCSERRGRLGIYRGSGLPLSWARKPDRSGPQAQ